MLAVDKLDEEHNLIIDELSTGNEDIHLNQYLNSKTTTFQSNPFEKENKDKLLAYLLNCSRQEKPGYEETVIHNELVKSPVNYQNNPLFKQLVYRHETLGHRLLPSSDMTERSSYYSHWTRIPNANLRTSSNSTPETKSNCKSNKAKPVRKKKLAQPKIKIPTDEVRARIERNQGIRIREQAIPVSIVQVPMQRNGDQPIQISLEKEIHGRFKRVNEQCMVQPIQQPTPTVQSIRQPTPTVERIKQSTPTIERIEQLTSIIQPTPTVERIEQLTSTIQPPPTVQPMHSILLQSVNQSTDQQIQEAVKQSSQFQQAFANPIQETMPQLFGIQQVFPQPIQDTVQHSFQFQQVFLQPIQLVSQHEATQIENQIELEKDLVKFKLLVVNLQTQVEHLKKESISLRSDCCVFCLNRRRICKISRLTTTYKQGKRWGNFYQERRTELNPNPLLR